MNDMKTVSVIMPVYNTEKYLSEAIESVLNQTYSDFELLLINDRSTDNSKQICIDYSKKDNRIRFFDNNTGEHGPGPTRNIGLDNAKGEYVYFMDSDDWIENNLLELSINRLKEDKSDMIMFGFVNEFYEKRKSENSPRFVKDIWTKEEIQNNILGYWNNRSISLWLHIISREVIGDTRIENIPLCEDDSFFFDILPKVRSISYLNSHLYHYRIHQGSLSHKWYDETVKYLQIMFQHEKMFVFRLCPNISMYDYTEIVMMQYLRIIYELSKPWCPYTYAERLRHINKSKELMEIRNLNRFIQYRNKSNGFEKLKYYLLKKDKEHIVLALGMFVLRLRFRL